MYLIVEFQTWNFDWTKLTDDDWVELHRVVPTLPDKMPENTYNIRMSPHVLNDESIRVVARLGIPFKISDEPASTAIGTMLVKLQDQIDRLNLTNERDNMARLAEKGVAVQIAIPDLGLLAIREVTHLDDCCTDYLQSYLNEGWRILAVCPPNSQRRPDYILGRGSCPTS